jgi:glycosyltransferase involved in cell wall biosynthesis
MKIHLYALCWNEADILPFFFRNYDPWVDRYIIYDDGSTDGSIEILQRHPQVEIRSMSRQFSDSHTMSQMKLLNEVWKESRGKADWVILVDMDEHLFVPQIPMRSLLERYKSEGSTLVPALGFQMLSENFPEADEYLAKTRSIGTPWHMMCKVSIINPDAIEETNCFKGRHTAKPSGQIKLPKRDEILLLHYKYLGFERTLEKQSMQNSHLGAYDNSMGIANNYSWTRQELRNHWDSFLKSAQDITLINNNGYIYPWSYRWWRFFPRWLIRAKRFTKDPVHMIKLLKMHVTISLRGLAPKSFKFLIDEINRIPIRKELYKKMIQRELNENGRETLIATFGKDNKSILIECMISVDEKKQQGNDRVKNVITARKEYEKNTNSIIDTILITNGNGFSKDTVKLANKNKVKLISRDKLIEFISQVNPLINEKQKDH